MIIGVVYQPPINSKHYEVNLYKNLEHEINELLENFPNYDIWLTGDFNTRTADKDSIEDIRDKNEGFKDILRNRGKRKSKDKVINLEGEKLIDFCIKENFYIMNGNYPQDLEGDFTYISKLGASTIDYILVIRGLKTEGKKF